jgi:hypothetical protein
MGHVAYTHQGTLLVQGKTTYTFYLDRIGKFIFRIPEVPMTQG